MARVRTLQKAAILAAWPRLIACRRPPCDTTAIQTATPRRDRAGRRPAARGRARRVPDRDRLRPGRRRGQSRRRARDLRGQGRGRPTIRSSCTSPMRSTLRPWARDDARRRAAARRRVLARAADADPAARARTCPTSSPAARTASACACRRIRSRARCCARSPRPAAPASPRRRPTASAASRRRPRSTSPTTSATTSR